MQIDFTEEEIRQKCMLYSDDNDIVRIVNPVNRKILFCTDPAREGDDYCHTVWNRGQRCENCTSSQVMTSKGRAFKFETVNGRYYWIMSRYLRVNGKSLVMETVNDITDHNLIETTEGIGLNRLIRLYVDILYHDELTGAYNRYYLDHILMESYEKERPERPEVVICILDIDYFKKINDTYGHLAGDEVLKDIVQFWKLYYDSKEKDHEKIVVRFGGDEMLIFLAGISLKEAVSDIERQYEEMRKVCIYHNQSIPVSTTLGFASSKELGGDWSMRKLLDLADKRMYQNKEIRKS